MPRVVPGQVVRFIASISLREFNGVVSMNEVGPARLSAVLDLVDQAADELLAMDNDTYTSFIHAKAQIKEILTTWTSNRNAGFQLQLFQMNSSQNPLARIRDALAKYPDESPAPGASELNFITDADLRTNLRDDMGRIDIALSNGEWKAATVLAGSTIEALLLWSLQQRPAADIITAIATLTARGALTRQPDANLARWDLHEFTEVAGNLRIIKADTLTEARLAREFRNLIHPGRAQRLGQTCDRGTALSCVAALDHVVRDLS
jgi:hypothetical protein